MLDFIPVEYYTSLYYQFLLIPLLLTFIKTKTISLTNSKNLKVMQKWDILLLLFVILYMGLRPIDYHFGDMVVYNKYYESYQSGLPVIQSSDYIFEFFMFSCSQVMTASMFFFVCSLLYVLPLWAACKKWFQEYNWYAFLALVISFSFWAYGTNGIRNGIATSLFVFALSRDKLVFKVLFVTLAVGFHKSLLIPAAALVLTYLYADPKKYFYGWLASIPLSLVLGSFWEGLFAGLMTDERANYLTTFKDEYKDSFSSTGFRWDFLLYSASAVYVAYFFLFKKKFVDPTYNRLVCIYLAANAFWILVIRASFSNRFAYLSWFMMGIIIVYPFLTKIQVKNQHKVLGSILIAYFSFTYLMNVILA